MPLLCWKLSFALVAVATATLVLPQVNSTLVAGRVRSSAMLPAVSRRLAEARPLRRVHLTGGAAAPEALRRRHPGVDFGAGAEGRFVPASARRVYVAGGGRVHFRKRARGVRVRWHGGRAPADRANEGYAVEGREGATVRLRGGASFLNPKVELTTVGRGDGDDVRLLSGGARPSLREFAAAAAETAAAIHGREARVLVVCRGNDEAAALLANQARLCFASPVRAVAPGSALGRSGGSLVVDGVAYPWVEVPAGPDGPLPAVVGEASASGVTLEDGTALPNPVRVAPSVDFGDADLCLVFGPLEEPEVPPGKAALAVAPDAPLDATLAAEVPTVVWAQRSASLPAASEPERLGLAELDAAVRRKEGGGGDDGGEFRALQRRSGRWWTVATCSLVPGRMADVRVFGEGRGLADHVPPGAPPDCAGADVPARLVVRSLAGQEQVAVGTVQGLGGGELHGSESATWELQCPQSGVRTLEIVGPVGLGEARAVVEVPERCDVPPCVRSRDVPDDS